MSMRPVVRMAPTRRHERRIDRRTACAIAANGPEAVAPERRQRHHEQRHRPQQRHRGEDQRLGRQLRHQDRHHDEHQPADRRTRTAWRATAAGSRLSAMASSRRKRGRTPCATALRRKRDHAEQHDAQQEHRRVARSAGAAESRMRRRCRGRYEERGVQRRQFEHQDREPGIRQAAKDAGAKQAIRRIQHLGRHERPRRRRVARRIQSLRAVHARHDTDAGRKSCIIAGPMPDLSDSERLLANAARTIDRRDAEILLAACWRKSRSQLLAAIGETVPAEVAARFEDARRQRADGVPVAYLLGRREFWSLEFAVNPAVLVPRPETELLVQRVLDLVARARCGRGGPRHRLRRDRHRARARAPALASARHRRLRPGARGGARQRRAAGRRPRRMGAGRLVRARSADRRFDVLVSNPPYVAADDPVLVEDGLRHEPRGALTPDGDGIRAPWPLLLMAPPGTCSPAAGWRSNTAPRRAKRCVRCLWPVASLT